jgi:hypothetical protein
MIASALQSLRPSAQWSLNGDDYEGLNWLDTHQTKPTKAEVNAEIARLLAAYSAKEYARNRVKEYPSIGDQLDALWKGGDAAAEMLAKVQAVKVKYPKGVA